MGILMSRAIVAFFTCFICGECKLPFQLQLLTWPHTTKLPFANLQFFQCYNNNTGLYQRQTHRHIQHSADHLNRPNRFGTCGLNVSLRVVSFRLVFVFVSVFGFVWRFRTSNLSLRLRIGQVSSLVFVGVEWSIAHLKNFILNIHTCIYRRVSVCCETVYVLSVCASYAVVLVSQFKRFRFLLVAIA